MLNWILRIVPATLSLFGGTPASLRPLLQHGFAALEGGGLLAPAPWKAVTLWQQKIALIGGVEIDKNFYRGTLDELCRVMGGA